MTTSSTPSTRSRTRTLRRFSNDNGYVGDVFRADEPIHSLLDEEQWEDMSDTSDPGDSGTTSSRNTPSAIRRDPRTPRSRKRPRNPYTPTRKSTITNGTSRSETPTPNHLKFSSQEKRNDGLGEGNNNILSSPQVPMMPKISTNELVGGASQGISFSIRYIFDVIRTALALLRKPLGVLLFLWLLAMILSMISSTLRSAFAPICWLPGISSSLMCRPLPQQPIIQQADYPRLIEAQSKTFEQLLDETVGGSALSLEVKKAELATSDLVTLVRISSLQSKDALAPLLVDFIHDAKKTGRRLQKLHAKVGGSVDSIMAVNEHALRTIETANSKKPFLSLDTLNPWSRSRETRLVASTFTDAMDTLSTQVSRLIIEAEANLGNLNDLEERLNTLHEIVSGDVKVVSADREELLANLWTILGGNRKELKNFSENLSLLKNIGKYRRQALVHVVAALQTLQSLSEDMEELRERVATPGLVGENIPLVVQMKSIQLGLERLRENRIKARRMEEAAVREVVGSVFVDEIGA